MNDFVLFAENITYLLPCHRCGIDTNHKMTASGVLMCWCGTEYVDPQKVADELKRDAHWLGSEQE